MTTTPNAQSAPQISTPEATTESMVAPGQENLLEDFIQEQQAQQEPELLAGKFKSVEDLERSYRELEKKLGRPQQQQADPEASPPTEGYTPEVAVQVYGKEAVDALAEKGLDLADVMFKADSGQDISRHYDALAEVFNVPRQLVENYVGAAQARSESSESTLSESDAASIKAMVGGEQAFVELSQWAASNLSADELAEYNSAVDSGNKAAIQWALRALVARRAAPDAVVEPKLYGGGDAPTQTRFESQQQVLDAMAKLNERGQRLYEVDEAYRAKIQKMLAVSDVF